MAKEEEPHLCVKDKELPPRTSYTVANRQEFLRKRCAITVKDKRCNYDAFIITSNGVFRFQRTSTNKLRITKQEYVHLHCVLLGKDPDAQEKWDVQHAPIKQEGVPWTAR